MKNYFSRQISLHFQINFPKTPEPPACEVPASGDSPGFPRQDTGEQWDNERKDCPRSSAIRTNEFPWDSAQDSQHLAGQARPSGWSVSLPKNPLAAAHIPDSSRPEGVGSPSAPAVAGELIAQGPGFLPDLRAVIRAGRHHGPATGEQQHQCRNARRHSPMSHFFLPLMTRAQRTTSSSGCRVSRSHPDSVTTLVCPKHIACPESLSIKIMWRKNTMFGSATTGLPW